MCSTLMRTYSVNWLTWRKWNKPTIKLPWRLPVPISLRRHLRDTRQWTSRSSLWRILPISTVFSSKLSHTSSSKKKSTVWTIKKQITRHLVESLPCLTSRTIRCTGLHTKTYSSGLTLKSTTSTWAGVLNLNVQAFWRHWRRSHNFSIWKTFITQKSKAIVVM